VVRLVEKPVHFFSHMDARLKTLDEAQAEVTALRQQNAELQLQNQLLADKGAENARLREMLGYREASQYRLRPCRVVSREPSNWWTTVQVNVGWQDEPDLKPDQPVVSPRGVVGKTGTVTRDVTDVILMVDKNCSISALVEDAPAAGAPTDPSGNHDHGIVQGEGNFEEGTPLVKILYLPKDSQVGAGQFVVTSGLGPYFPAGLRLGTIKEVPALTKTYPTFGLYREAVVEPTADLNHLDELFIVLGPKQNSDIQPAPDTNTAPSP
jgi:rod shape-determining protein MreC